MEAEKISMKNLLYKITDLKTLDGVDSVGSYLYNGYHVQISEHNLTCAERVGRLYYRRRNNGLCVNCGKKVTRMNPKTGKLYRLCEKHRKQIDLKKRVR